jgi:hypothetical protein
VRRVGGVVEQARSSNAPNRVDNPRDDFGTAPFADVRYALDDRHVNNPNSLTDRAFCPIIAAAIQDILID